jgi:hypothetical protein
MPEKDLARIGRTARTGLRSRYKSHHREPARGASASREKPDMKDQSQLQRAQVFGEK